MWLWWSPSNFPVSQPCPFLQGSERNEGLRIVARVMVLATLTLPLLFSLGLSFLLHFLCMPQTSTWCLLQSYVSTHLEAACCAGNKRMLLLWNLDTQKRDPLRHCGCEILAGLIIFDTHIPSIYWRMMENLSTLTPLHLLCRNAFSSVFQY